MARQLRVFVVTFPDGTTDRFQSTTGLNYPAVVAAPFGNRWGIVRRCKSTGAADRAAASSEVRTKLVGITGDPIVLATKEV